MFLSFSPIFRKIAFRYGLYTNRARMLSNEMTCTHFTLYSNTMKHTYGSNFKRAKSQYNASYLSTSKLKVSFVFHFYFPAVYFGDINLLPFLQRFWLMLCVLGHLCLARTTQFSADHDFYYSTRTKILQLSNRNLAIPNLQMCLGMQLT